MKKIYVVGNSLNYSKFIDSHTLVDNIEDADIVLFTGGEDVSPSLYNCRKHPLTHSNLERDKYEKAIFEKIKPNQLAVGVCRGSQFICIMNGGKLIQDVTGHAIGHTHSIYEPSTCKEYEITSTHHQMQYPFDLPKCYWTCLFYSTIPLSRKYDGDKIGEVPYEPEIVLYHIKGLPKCLAIQGHPEYMRPESPIILRLNEIINSLLTDEN